MSAVLLDLGRAQIDGGTAIGHVPEEINLVHRLTNHWTHTTGKLRGAPALRQRRHGQANWLVRGHVIGSFSRGIERPLDPTTREACWSDSNTTKRRRVAASSVAPHSSIASASMSA